MRGSAGDGATLVRAGLRATLLAGAAGPALRALAPTTRCCGGVGLSCAAAGLRCGTSSGGRAGLSTGGPYLLASAGLRCATRRSGLCRSARSATASG